MGEMEKDMKFGEHENQVQEEMGIQVLSPPPENDSQGNLASEKTKPSAIAEKAIAIAPPGNKDGPTMEIITYRECQKNHARSIGGYTVDGCGEFLGAGEEGTLEALICAACNCHRNFHRKEIDGVVDMSSYHHQPWPQPQPPLHHHHNQLSAYYHHMPPPPPGAGCHHHLVATPPMSQHRPLALLAASGGGFVHEEEDMSNPSSSAGGRAKKRFRTKFTQEQKDKMLAFAEKLGWRIQKHDAATVEQFCAETGVKRQVLKVWMHNNKHTLGMKT